MYIDFNEISQYPFEGVFYRNVVDNTKPLIEQVEENKEVFRTQCDIVEGRHSRGRTLINADWQVSFPFNKDTEKIVVRNGDIFKGEIYGMLVEGKVIGVFPSQIGGCSVYVDDLEA